MAGGSTLECRGSAPKRPARYAFSRFSTPRRGRKSLSGKKAGFEVCIAFTEPNLIRSKHILIENRRNHASRKRVVLRADFLAGSWKRLTRNRTRGRMQIVMQFIEHNDAAFSKGVEPKGRRERIFFGFRETLRLYLVLPILPPIGLMPQKDIHPGPFPCEFFGEILQFRGHILGEAYPVRNPFRRSVCQQLQDRLPRESQRCRLGQSRGSILPRSRDPIHQHWRHGAACGTSRRGAVAACC